MNASQKTYKRTRGPFDVDFSDEGSQFFIDPSEELRSASTATGFDVSRVEKKFKRRYSSLQRAYEQRLSSILNQIPQLVRERFEQDEIVQTLRQDSSTCAFIPNRTEEIMKETVLDEKEMFIERLVEQCALHESSEHQLKSENQTLYVQLNQHKLNTKQQHQKTQSLQHQLLELSQQYRQLEDQTVAERAIYEEKLKQTTEQSEFGQRSSLENERKVFEREIRSLHAKLQEEQSKHQQTKQKMKERESLLEKSMHDDDISKFNLQKRADEARQQMERMREKMGLIEEENDELEEKYQALGKQVEMLLEEEAQANKQIVTRLHSKKKKLADDLAREKDKSKQYLSELEAARKELQNTQEKMLAYDSKCADLQVLLTEQKMKSTRRMSELEAEIAQVIRTTNESLEMEKITSEELQDQLRQQREMYETKIQHLQTSLSSYKESTSWNLQNGGGNGGQLDDLQAEFDSMVQKQQKDVQYAQVEAKKNIKQAQKEALLHAQNNSNAATSELFQSLLRSRLEEQAMVLKSTHISKMDHETAVKKAVEKAKEGFKEKTNQQLKELEEKKANEFKMTMLNVRQGIKKLETELVDVKQKNTAAEMGLEKTKKRLEEASDALGSERKMKTSLSSQLDEATTNIGRLKSLLEDSTSKLKELQDMKLKHDSAVNENEIFRQRLDEKETALEELQNRMREEMTETAKRHANDLESEQASHFAIVQEKDKYIHQLEERIDRLKDQVLQQQNEQKRQVEEIQVEGRMKWTELNQEYEKLSEKMSKQLDENTKLKLERSELKQAFDLIQQGLKEKQKKLDEAREEKSLLRNGLEKGKRVTKQQYVALRHMKSQLGQLREELANVRKGTRMDLDGLAMEMSRSYNTIELKLLETFRTNEAKKDSLIQSKLSELETQFAKEKVQLEAQQHQSVHEVALEKSKFELIMQKKENEIQRLKNEVEILEKVKGAQEKQLTRFEKDTNTDQIGQAKLLKEFRQSHYNTTDFYSQVLVIVCHAIHLYDRDKEIIHEMQTYWNKSDTLSDYKLVSPVLIQKFQTSLSNALGQLKQTVEKPLKEELTALQVSVGLISRTEGNGSETLATKLFESQKRLKDLEYQLQVKGREVKSMEQKITEIKKTTECQAITTESEIKTLKDVIDEEKSRRKSELQHQAERYEKQITQAKEYHLDERERVVEEYRHILAGLESRLKVEQKKSQELRDQLFQQAEMAEKSVQGAHQANRELAAELECRRQDVKSAEIALRDANDTTHRLLRSSSSLPRESGKYDYGVSKLSRTVDMTELSHLMEKTLREMDLDSSSSDLDSSARALKRRVRRQSELFQQKVNRAKGSKRYSTNSRIISSPRGRLSLHDLE